MVTVAFYYDIKILYNEVNVFVISFVNKLLVNLVYIYHNYHIHFPMF